jgi:hypothetical protein
VEYRRRGGSNYANDTITRGHELTLPTLKPAIPQGFVTDFPAALAYTTGPPGFTARLHRPVHRQVHLRHPALLHSQSPATRPSSPCATWIDTRSTMRLAKTC